LPSQSFPVAKQNGSKKNHQHRNIINPHNLSLFKFDIAAFPSATTSRRTSGYLAQSWVKAETPSSSDMPVWFQISFDVANREKSVEIRDKF